MSPEILRRAAAEIREQAEAAAATGVWRGDESDATTEDDGPFTHYVSTFANPAVALAVADWLTDAAYAASDPDEGWIHPDALAVARAYLGEQA